MNKETKKYFIASSKPWHYENFKKKFNNNNLAWHYVSTENELTKLLESVTPRFIFFLHWNWIVSDNICSKYDCVCFHMTDLPYGRGGSPLQNLILDGKETTYLSAFKMVKELDAGPIYTKAKMKLDGRAEEIYLRAGQLSWQIIDWIVKNEPLPFPQKGKVTEFKRRNETQSKLPENGSIQDIYNFIRMLDAPTYPYCFIEHGKFKIELTNAEIIDNKVSGTFKLTSKDN